jgi:Ni,Fe-hydrogenase III large subunit
LAAIGDDLDEIVAIALANSTVVDRFTGTAVLRAPEAADIGVVGPVARASGLPFDARLAHPPTDGLYDTLPVAVQHNGDVMARFQVRVEEAGSSLVLLGRLLGRVEPGDRTSVPLHVSGPDRRSGVGIVEGWRGALVHRVEVDERGGLTRVKIVDPSFLNWPALPVALADTIVPDFPLANKSFNLSYAGNDL